MLKANEKNITRKNTIHSLRSFGCSKDAAPVLKVLGLLMEKTTLSRHPLNKCLILGVANHVVFVTLLIFIYIHLQILNYQDYGEDSSGLGLFYFLVLGPLFVIQALVEGIVVLLLLVLPAWRFTDRDRLSLKLFLTFFLTLFISIVFFVFTSELFTLVESRETGTF